MDGRIWVFLKVDFWQQIPGLEGVDISAVAINSKRDIFVGSDSGRICRKMENENGWTRFDIGLTNYHIRTIAFHSTDVLFADISSDIFYSLDNGENWSQVKWDANGNPSGIYLYRIRTGEYVQTRKLTFIK